MRVAVALSGGRDSLAALLRLRAAGCDVVALHGRFATRGRGPAEDVAADGLARLCADLGVEFHVLDLRAEFEREVIAPFVADYLAGRTPNPCVRCNAAIKFGLFFDRAREFGAEALATGHYARVGAHPAYGWALSRGTDATRDQSYFLSLVPQERLRAALFPLAEVRKADLAAEQEAAGVAPPLPEESREICFVPGDDYRAFLAGRVGDLPGPGPAVLPDGAPVGAHQGLWRSTIGQRRGLGLSWREPLYVLRRDMDANTLVVAPKRMLLVDGFAAAGLNVLADPQRWPERVFVQTRYRETPKAARVELDGAALRVTYAAPQLRPAPGQTAAVYDAGGAVLAGAIIPDSAGRSAPPFRGCPAGACLPPARP